jgi:hypothetical protein
MSLILSGSDGLSDVDGSAATPAIRGTDANTGIFFGTDIIGFSEGGVEAMRLNASGNLQTIGTISVGNATPSTSGAGITFPATQSASSDANTLDDYEEGTFTPTVTSTTGTITTASAAGFYTKIGRSVNITCAVTITTGGTGGGTLKVAGAPFTNANTFQVSNLIKEVDIFGNAGYYCYLLNAGTEIRIEATPSGAPSYTNGVKYCFTLTYITS